MYAQDGMARTQLDLLLRGGPSLVLQAKQLVIVCLVGPFFLLFALAPVLSPAKAERQVRAISLPYITSAAARCST